MLNIQIDNPDLEANIKYTYGDNPQSIAQAFSEFIQTKAIKRDINVSIKELENGEALSLSSVFKNIRATYE